MLTQTNPTNRPKIRLGHIHADAITAQGALDVISQAILDKKGGYVVTPNVDHVCLAETHVELREAYQHASLALVDGMPLVWLSWGLGHRLPEKISGSDFIFPLMDRAAQSHWGVYLLGGQPGIASCAAERFKAMFPRLKVVGMDAPPWGFEGHAEQSARVLEHIKQASADLIVVALGCPKQELWMYRSCQAYAPALAIGLGASLDFVAGSVRRAPAWMSRWSLEWLYRLFQEPQRMAHRYLVRDRAIVRIAWRMLRLPKSQRVFF